MAATSPNLVTSPTSETASDSQSIYTPRDLAIIGGGPAALSAALYAARAGLKVKVFERSGVGGALAEISHLTNYPGFDGLGPSLAEKMRTQAIKAGAEIIYGECKKLWRYSDHFELLIDDEPVRANQVLIATGSAPKHLDFTPKPPVSYCALCDGDLVKGKHIAVIGGANSAVQESLYLANLAADLTIITHSRLKADAYLQKRLEKAQKTQPITVLENTEPTPELLDEFDHIFVFIGKNPSTDFLHPFADTLLSDPPLLDKEGYVVTVPAEPRLLPDNPCLSSPAISEEPSHATIIPGLYAAGDVRSGSLKQVITAAADGATAAIEIATATGLSTPE